MRELFTHPYFWFWLAAAWCIDDQWDAMRLQHKQEQEGLYAKTKNDELAEFLHVFPLFIYTIAITVFGILGFWFMPKWWYPFLLLGSFVVIGLLRKILFRYIMAFLGVAVIPISLVLAYADLFGGFYFDAVTVKAAFASAYVWYGVAGISLYCFLEWAIYNLRINAGHVREKGVAHFIEVYSVTDILSRYKRWIKLLLLPLVTFIVLATIFSPIWWYLLAIFLLAVVVTSIVLTIAHYIFDKIWVRIWTTNFLKVLFPIVVCIIIVFLSLAYISLFGCI